MRSTATLEVELPVRRTELIVLFWILFVVWEADPNRISFLRRSSV